MIKNNNNMIFNWKKYFPIQLVATTENIFKRRFSGIFHVITCLLG